MADPWAVVSHKPASTTPSDPWAVVAHQPAEQGDPDSTGVLGPDQTAPNAGLAPPAGANKNIVPSRSVGLLRSDFYDDNFNPVTEINKPRQPANLAEKAFLKTAAPAQQGMEDLGIDPTQFNPNQEIHPVKAANEFIRAGANWSLPMLPVAGALAPIKTAAVLGTGYLAGKGTKAATGLVTQDPDNLELAENLGNIAGGAGMASKVFKGAPGATPKAGQEKAFNVLHPDNAVADESILPELRNAAAQDAQANPANPITKMFGARPKVEIGSGKQGVKRVAKIAQKAIDAHEAQVQSLKQPFMDQGLDTSPASQAALDKITPEMRQAAASDPGVAREIATIEGVARRAQGAKTVGLADQLRHTWNDELNADYGKSEASQDVSASATQAKRAAVNALRDSFYGKLSELSGQDVRSLAQKEGKLMEAKAGVTQSGNVALKSRGNDSSRGQQMAKVAKRVSLTKPATIVSALPDMIKAVINPEGQTPTGQYLSRAKRALADLPDPKSFTAYEAPPLAPGASADATAPISPIPPELQQVLSGGTSDAAVPEAIKKVISPESDRGAGLRDRRGGSVIPERGKAYKTNEQTQMDAMDRITRAGIHSSDMRDIKAQMAAATTPEEKAYLDQKFKDKRGQYDREMHGDSAVLSPKIAQAETNDFAQAKKNLGLAPNADYSPQIVQEAQRIKDQRLGKTPPALGVPKPISDLISPDRVEMRHQDGTVGTVPASQVREALAQGFTLTRPLTAS